MPVYTPDATAPFVMAAPSYPSLAPTDPSLNPQGSFYPGMRNSLSLIVRLILIMLVLGYSTLLGTTQTGFYDPSSANSSSAQVQSDFYAQGPGLMGSSFGGLGLGQFLDMMICPLKPIHIVDPVTYSASSIYYVKQRGQLTVAPPRLEQLVCPVLHELPKVLRCPLIREVVVP